jgi:hypothetical protein
MSYISSQVTSEVWMAKYPQSSKAEQPLGLIRRAARSNEVFRQRSISHIREIRLLCVILLIGLVPRFTHAQATAPTINIGNDILHVAVYPPNATTGFYRGTRFDWSGVIGSLKFAGHDYYGPWFSKTDPTVIDFVRRGSDIVAGPCSAITGPAEEFLSTGKALGYDEAPAGGTFIKIGVGVLRKPDTGPYNSFRLYQIIDPGKREIRSTQSSVEFIHEVFDPSSGYGYKYRKTIRLVPGKPEMVIEHTLTNTGKRPLETSVYDHNFLVLDKQSIGPDFRVTVPFKIHPMQPIKPDAAAKVQGNQIVYTRELQFNQGFAMNFDGFGPTSHDYNIKVENTKVGAGMSVISNRPLESIEIWSIRSVLAVEPYVHMSIKPNESFSWHYVYSYYKLP